MNFISFWRNYVTLTVPNFKTFVEELISTIAFKIMKNNVSLKTVFIKIAFVSITLLSVSACNHPKLTSTIDFAEGYNEVSFDNPVKENDAQFLKKAAEINLEEIKFGQLALENCMITDAIELGKMMKQVHTNSMFELDKLAEKKLINISVINAENMAADYQNLNAKKGIDFDIEYCDKTVSSLKESIELFEIALNNSNDRDIQQWAEESLPVLNSHLKFALNCQKKCEK